MKKIVLFFLIIYSACAYSQCLRDTMVVYTPEDKLIFDDYVSKFQDRKDLPIGEIFLETGFYFLDTPYVSYTLEVAQPEKLIVNFHQLDCTTFTETCLALSRMIKNNCGFSIDNYACELMKIRYRNGNLDGYTSRLHYFSDWIYSNDKAGIVKDVTHESGGVHFPIMVDAMTRLSKNYVQLSDTSFVRRIAEIQKEISSRTYYYIPKTRIDSIDIHNGDILVLTVSGKGMDIMHMGIAVIKNNTVYFMHASSKFKQVMITEVPFKEYLAGIKSNTGYMIVRPQETKE